MLCAHCTRCDVSLEKVLIAFRAKVQNATDEWETMDKPINLYDAQNAFYAKISRTAYVEGDKWASVLGECVVCHFMWMQMPKQCMHTDNILWPWDLSALLFLWLAQLLFCFLPLPPSPPPLLPLHSQCLCCASETKRGKKKRINENKIDKIIMNMIGIQ